MKTLFAGISIVFFLCLSASAEPEAPRPNFLLMYTDDQHWDTIGVAQREEGSNARFPWFQTPNLDRLANEGFRCRNAFCVCSLCSPGRGAILTGQYPHMTGIVHNQQPFPDTLPTYASLLRKAGYTTAFIGKWHMGSQHGKRPGFDFSASFIGQGTYGGVKFEVNGVPTPSQGWTDDTSANYAIDFITKNKDKPFCVAIGFKSPHGPWFPADRNKNRYENEKILPPVNANAKPPFPRADSGVLKAGKKGKEEISDGENISAAEVQEKIKDYFRCIYGVDENIGRLLDTLENLGLSKNTMIIFLTDNGFYLGEHGLSNKCSDYEESLRIPFLVRYPALPNKGVLIDQMVLNIDIAPTMLDFAGVPIPSQMQGKSFRPLLEGQKTEWRKEFLFEYFGGGDSFTPPIVGVRTESGKYITYPHHDDWRELFNLDSDSHEMKNLVKDPSSLDFLHQMESELNRLIKDFGYDSKSKKNSG